MASSELSFPAKTSPSAATDFSGAFDAPSKSEEVVVRLRRTPAHVPAARRKTDDLSGTYPAYTEDITVAGSLLKDRLSLILDTITGRDEERKFELAHCLNVDKVQLVNRFGAESNIVGTVHVTTTHLIFRADDGSKEIWIANGLIGSVERGSLSIVGCPLIIRCKHFQILSLLIKSDKACQDLYVTLQRCSRPGCNKMFVIL
ncbi:hypothetical protein WR25_14662 [Diploscapter pachys]|uniref:MTMR6-9 GRAM domain-containing protein n=1 Tax=Diploscapter pachys TaxID=2018661 RepID=A0A2A2LJI0_9BILA|nr:hypothetical protein WR25_14662 [Diploscapter pachys]